MVGIGVVEALEVPAAVGGELGDAVAALGDQLPELLGRVDPARVAAGHADDRDRLLARLGADRDLPRGAARGRLAQQVLGQAPRRRVVEDRRRPAGRRPVALLSRLRSSTAASESKPSSWKALLGLDLLRRGVAEDRRHLRPDQVKDEALALCLGQGRELGGERARGGAAALGGAHQAAEDRRQGAGRGQGPEAGAVDRRRASAWGRSAARAASKSARPCSSESASIPPRRIRARSASPRPEAMPPSRSQRPQAIEVAGQAFRLALLGEGVEEDVGGGVVGLAGSAEGARRRGEEDEGGEVQRPRSARAGSRRRRPWGRRRARSARRRGTRPCRRRATPAQWITAPSGCSSGIESRSFFSALRSETSQAAIVPPLPALRALPAALRLPRPRGRSC